MHGSVLHYIVWDAWRLLLFIGGGNQKTASGKEFVAGIVRVEKHDLLDPSGLIEYLKGKEISQVNSIKWLACHKTYLNETSHVLAPIDIDVGKKRKRLM